jgi:hypothetical protein
MPKIELDTVVEDDETTRDVVNRMINGLPDVTATIITEQGPGGGWPLVAYEGSEVDLAIVQIRYETW